MFEQCKAKLGNRLTSKQVVIDFAKEWGDGRYVAGDQDEAKFIKTNIDRIVVEALARKMLFQLGEKLGVRWDAEANGTNVVAMDDRSRDIIGFIGGVILAVVLAALFIVTRGWEKRAEPPANAGTDEKEGIVVPGT